MGVGERDPHPNPHVDIVLSISIVALLWSMSQMHHLSENSEFQHPEHVANSGRVYFTDTQRRFRCFLTSGSSTVADELHFRVFFSPVCVSSAALSPLISISLL